MLCVLPEALFCLEERPCVVLTCSKAHEAELCVDEWQIFISWTL